jgi:hypothetical protein
VTQDSVKNNQDSEGLEIQSYGLRVDDEILRIQSQELGIYFIGTLRNKKKQSRGRNGGFAENLPAYVAAAHPAGQGDWGAEPAYRRTRS